MPEETPKIDRGTLFEFQHAHEFPYTQVENPDWAMKAALAIINSLGRNRYVEHELHRISEEDREGLLEAQASIIRAALLIRDNPAMAVEPPRSDGTRQGLGWVLDRAKDDQEPDYQIWTARIHQHRKVRAAGIHFFDITVKSGDRDFAPTWDNLMEYKRGNMDMEEYTLRYLGKIQNLSESVWEKIKEHKRVAYACYCAPGQFCHRHIFVNEAIHRLCKQGFLIERMGEFEEPQGT